ncbi:ExeM/NucH family extracellular endonuclease [Shewanella surugensis]|uniref:ExeM/NucH family extracellular endonuclease n=1 Tax=Shewanella surugensis TaxID=212020 RepID=A0ABT0L8R5_9GAMM|nr:ExeM/NucH family extracellular endonuclease [Shewanella surugensis]MCL1124076.1 ExeM/NucH family extracellular endonuclease [Shewanella surugensis]
MVCRTKLTMTSLALATMLPSMAHADMNSRNPLNEVLTNTIAIEIETIDCSNSVLTPIYDVQGTESTSPLATIEEGVDTGVFYSEHAINVKGVVTARGEELLKGFYLKEVGGENSPFSSDGIFVALSDIAPEAIQPGVEVCVQGKVKEDNGLTQIDLSIEPKIEIGGAIAIPEPVLLFVSDGESLTIALERVEGMKIKLDINSDMHVSRNFGYDGSVGRNNLMLSHKGSLIKATQVSPALSNAAIAIETANKANRLILESDIKAPDGVIPYFNDFNAQTAYIRVGDRLTSLEGMVSFSDGEYRLIATNTVTAADFTHAHDREAAPEIAEHADLRVASFNVLNFFTSGFGGHENVTQGDDIRGAKTAADLELQRTKIVNALVEMNADIIGLMEIENNGFGDNSAIQDLLNALNKELAKELAYQFIEVAPSDKYQGAYLGTDSIMVGLLYRLETVSPVNDAFVIAMPEQHVIAEVADRGVAANADNGTEAEPDLNPAFDQSQRYSLGQTFSINEDSLTVVVNHFKSKGSACFEDWVDSSEFSDPSDLQGHCNEFRVSAAKILAESVKSIEGDLLIIGDLNSYGMEDPIRVLTDYDASELDFGAADTSVCPLKAANSTTDPAPTAQPICTASWTTLEGNVYEREGSKIDKGYGLINLNRQENGLTTYSYNYNGENGSLDYAIGNESLADKVVSVIDWHINSTESNLFEYSSQYTGTLKKEENVYSSSDHDPLLIDLYYPDAGTIETPEITPKAEEDDGGSLQFMGIALLALFSGLRRRASRL